MTQDMLYAVRDTLYNAHNQITKKLLFSEDLILTEIETAMDAINLEILKNKRKAKKGIRHGG